MSYREVLSQAYSLTIRNPLLWLFGLVMLGGFNLSLINFFSLVPGGEWKQWLHYTEGFFGSPAASISIILVTLLVSFVVLNLVKVGFIVTAHRILLLSLIPRDSNDYQNERASECSLCVLEKSQAETSVTLPYFDWLAKVIAASALTIAMTVGVTLAANLALGYQWHDNSVALIVNLVFVAAVACMFGTWNAFTSYFIILHGLNFKAAAAASVDLLTKHTRRVVEFVILLSVLYSFSVLIGGSLLEVWNSEFIKGANPIIRWVFLVLPLLWLAMNNAFFNIAFLIFFNKTVKSIQVETELKPVTQAQ